MGSDRMTRVVPSRTLDSLILFVTNACNLRCGFCCYAEHLNKTRDIATDDLLKISETTPPFRALLVSGGEPFLRGDLDRVLLAFVRNNGVRNVNIPTNGWYLDRTLATCRAFLDDAPGTVLNVSFSVDGLAATHDRLRGREGSFRRLCETLSALEEWRDRDPGLRLRVNSVVTAENVDEIRDVIDWFHERFALDEHALAIVRDLKWLGAWDPRPGRDDLAERLVELVGYASSVYARSASARTEVPFLPTPVGRAVSFAHARAMAEVKRARMNGEPWGFPCTAGRNIFVISGSGALQACEHRDVVVDLRDFDFDVSAALATGAMDAERDRIACDRCDCLHGCFIGNSLQHSPAALLHHELPHAVRYVTRRRAPEPVAAGP
jgi:MoaA/NifB/PqqE/SkfB family radical SAM enzyme